MKATIRDIAEATGLSTATVDRALHNRKTVSPTARQRVLIAARDLGYLAEEGAVAMPSRPAHLEFIIPVGTNAFLADLAADLAAVSEKLPLVASCKIHPLDSMEPEEMVAAAANVSTRTMGLGVVAVDHPTTREVLGDLCQAGTRVVTIATDIPGVPRAAYVGVDNRAAGRTAGLMLGRLLGSAAAKVAVLLGSRFYRGHEEREMGFLSVVKHEFPSIAIVDTIEVHDRSAESYVHAAELLRKFPDIGGIYSIGGGRSGISSALMECGRSKEVVFICHELAQATRKLLLEGVCDVVIDQSSRSLAEQTVISLLGSLASSAPYLEKRFIEPRIIMRENIPPRY